MVGALEDKKFVVSGTFMESGTGREGIETLIQSNGGKVMTAVSGKTNYVVVGATLEDGRPGTEGSKYRAAIEKGVKVLGGGAPGSPTQAQPAVAPSSASKNFNEARATGAPLQAAATRELNSGAMPAAAEELLWVDKYKPGHTHDIIGTDATFKNLLQWLHSWEARHLKKTLKLPTFSKEPGAKAVLLSGLRHWQDHRGYPGCQGGRLRAAGAECQ